MQATGINGCHINQNNRPKAILILKIGIKNAILSESNHSNFKAN